MKSKKFVLRCCDCDREIMIQQSKELIEKGKISENGIAVVFKGDESGIYCECGSYIEIW
ncbi:hypothetical protein [Clostridium sp.]|uniref:hypothetical protein n=1 Tax=Clostridium sp. TaxID=1506 RepID=UPI00359F523C